MKTLNEIYVTESDLAKKSAIVNDDKKVRYHLGRAHIISQKNVFHHLYTHVLMLKHAISVKDSKEVLAQMIRLVVTMPGHMIGKVPLGNIGWSVVGLTQEMPIPEDIARHSS